MMRSSLCFSLVRGLNSIGWQTVRNEGSRSPLCAALVLNVQTIHKSARKYATSTGGWTSTSTADLKDKVALVTGCTSGIGLGIAHSLASRGCHIMMNGFGDPDYISALQEEFVTKYKCRTEFSAADLTKADAVKGMCDFALKQFPGGVDIVVNNAGFQHVSPVEDFAEDKWDAMIAVMLTAPFQVIKYLLPRMKEKGWGRIVNVASVHGVRASPNKAAYVSAKHGIVGLSKVVGLETAGTGVTCNALCPGYVDTPILQMQVKTKAENENLTYDEAKGKFLANFHPTKEPVGIDHLGDMVAFLCSDSGSQMTGQAVIMDGGWTAK